MKSHLLLNRIVFNVVGWMMDRGRKKSRIRRVYSKQNELTSYSLPWSEHVSTYSYYEKADGKILINEKSKDLEDVLLCFRC